MKSLKIMVVVSCVSVLLAGSAMPAEKKAKKLTCCQQAAAQGRECRNKCCITAHKQGKSCEKCNPDKEDLKLKKAENRKQPDTRKPTPERKPKSEI